MKNIKFKIQNTKSKGFTPLEKSRSKRLPPFVHTKSGFLKGFTLVEIIVAMTVVTIGVLAVINLFPRGLRLARESKETSVAINLTQEKIEELIAQNYDDIPTGIIEAKDRVDNNPSSQFYIYQRETQADYADSNLNTTAQDTELKKITVTVFWIENGREKTVQIVRLLNKR